MKVIFLDIDGVLNSKNTPIPANCHILLIGGFWHDLSGFLIAPAQRSFCPPLGATIQRVSSVRNAGAFRLLASRPICRNGRGAMRC